MREERVSEVQRQERIGPEDGYTVVDLTLQYQADRRLSDEALLADALRAVQQARRAGKKVVGDW